MNIENFLIRYDGGYFKQKIYGNNDVTITVHEAIRVNGENMWHIYPKWITNPRWTIKSFHTTNYDEYIEEMSRYLGPLGKRRVRRFI